MAKIVVDFYSMLKRFDEAVQFMGQQDYDLKQIVSDWRLGYSEDDLARQYSSYASNEDDDNTILFKAVCDLYRQMDRKLPDVDKRKVRKITMNLKEEVLVVEVNS